MAFSVTFLQSSHLKKIVLKYEIVNAEKQKKNKWTNSAGQEELPDEIREIPWKKDIGESQKCK